MVFALAVLTVLLFVPYMLVYALAMALGALAAWIHDSMESANMLAVCVVLLFICAVGIIVDIALRS